jgi:predicted dinucleotide-binding enzyme
VSKFGVLGSGEVGQTLAAGLKKKGHEARIASRDPSKLKDFSASSGISAGTFADVARWAEHAVLAVKGTASLAAIAQAGVENLRGKLVIDATNPISDDPPQDGVLHFFTDPNSSLLEQLQEKYPEIRFVKCFNSVGADLMVDPKLSVQPSMFYCGNDSKAKATVRTVLEQFGWDPADMGSAKAARAIEPLAVLWCIPGFRENRWNHAFKLVRE